MPLPMPSSAAGQVFVRDFAVVGSQDRAPRYKFKNVFGSSRILQPTADASLTGTDSLSPVTVMTSGAVTIASGCTWAMWVTATLAYLKTSASGSFIGGVTMVVSVTDFFGNAVNSSGTVDDSTAFNVPTLGYESLHGSPRKYWPSAVSSSSYQYVQFHRLFQGHFNPSTNAISQNPYTWTVLAYQTGVDAASTYTIPHDKACASLWIFDV